MKQITREEAAKNALAYIRTLLDADSESEKSDNPESKNYLDGPSVVDLLKKNFSRLDPNSDGISREELMAALLAPDSFEEDEYEMLRLVAKYFDTIINLADDEDGEELRITQLDLMVLEQFFVHGKMTLKELHKWNTLQKTVADEVGPPPLS
ncbi:MAG: hypothetical protein K2Z81_09625 [Cyanobacteria bacterium]|nr:hypothetical protein [Cyanobacteriota bacterium]